MTTWKENVSDRDEKLSRRKRVTKLKLQSNLASREKRVLSTYIQLLDVNDSTETNMLKIK